MGKKEASVSINFNSFASLLTTIFVVAKIAGYIEWSWWLVFSPMIAMTGLSLLILFVWITVKLYNESA